ncbi:urease accessory protein UreE [Pseudorhodoplanes sp.]|uniref:urease accessory protein UreE n=1 Tax=Pseudorhodoplanes sp. TaxID=1934341 RepID=UPI00391D5858
MHRVSTIAPAGSFDAAITIDRVTLDADDRQRRRIVLTGEKGTRVLLDFDRPVTLHDGDGLVLEDGTVVLVCGMPESLAEIAAASPRDFVRLAWHLGNRHTDVQIAGHRIRIRRDHVLEEMLRGLGAAVTAVEAPFEPQATVPHSHDHPHGHGDHRRGHAHDRGYHYYGHGHRHHGHDHDR